jgi:serine/threonine protein kinase
MPFPPPPANDLPDSGEQRVLAEALRRHWVSNNQIDRSLEARAAGRYHGAIHDVLLEQGLIDRKQHDVLCQFLEVGMVIDHFEIDRRLGAGAMGDVYLAHDTETGTQVALKIINNRYAADEQFVQRFHREIETLARINHPNIARAVGYGSHDNLPYLAIEYVDGPSLAQLLDRHGPLPEPYVLRVAIHVAQGLAHTYQTTGLVHRDIKPENILTVPAGNSEDDLFQRGDAAKLIDFGLARSYEQDERLTMTGITMGTPHYMSPEQIRGNQNIDHRSDIYGLGATMFHLLTGDTPYHGNSPAEVMTAHLTEAVPDPRVKVRGLSETTRKLIQTTMAKKAKERHASYDAFIRAAEMALEHFATRSEAPKLLRKPLVLTDRHKRKAKTDRHKRETTDAPYTPSQMVSTQKSRQRHDDDLQPTPNSGRHTNTSPITRRRTPSSTTAQAQRTDLLNQTTTSRTLRRNSHQRLVDELAAKNGIGYLPIIAFIASLACLGLILLHRSGKLG